MRLPRTQADALTVRARRLLADHRSRARRYGVTLDFGLPAIRALLASSPLCHWCKTVLDFSVSLDHVQPISRGGSFETSNLVAVCRRCQTLKGDLSGDEMEQLLRCLSLLGPVGRANLERRILAGSEVFSRGRRRKDAG